MLLIWHHFFETKFLQNWNVCLPLIACLYSQFPVRWPKIKANSIPSLSSPHSPQPSTPIEIYPAAKPWPAALGEPRNSRPTLKCQGCHCVLSDWISALLAASAALLVWVCMCWDQRKKARGIRKKIRVKKKMWVVSASNEILPFIFIGQRLLDRKRKIFKEFYFDFFQQEYS